MDQYLCTVWTYFDFNQCIQTEDFQCKEQLLLKQRFRILIYIVPTTIWIFEEIFAKYQKIRSCHQLLYLMNKLFHRLGYVLFKYLRQNIVKNMDQKTLIFLNLRDSYTIFVALVISPFLIRFLYFVLKIQAEWNLHPQNIQILLAVIKSVLFRVKLLGQELFTHR